MAIKKSQFQFTDIDKVSVRHYLMYGVKTEAYKFARRYDSHVLESSINSGASRYFNTEKIKILMELEKKKIGKLLGEIGERCGVKDLNQPNIGQNDSTTNVNVANLTKEEVLSYVTKLIRTNPNDSKTLKEHLPTLIKLLGMDKDVETDNNNITIYELPRYQ